MFLQGKEDADAAAVDDSAWQVIGVVETVMHVSLQVACCWYLAGTLTLTTDIVWHVADVDDSAW